MDQHRKASDERLRADIDVTARANRARRLIACSLWLYLGLVGASAVATGLSQLLDHDASALWAVVLAAAGVLLAVASWHRGWIALQGDERRAVDRSFAVGPEVTRLGRHARDCAELAAWPEAARRTRTLGRR